MMGDKIILADRDGGFGELDQEEFMKLDYVVMRRAFEIQNELGRMFDEKIYRNSLKRELSSSFENVETEVPIRTVFRDFEKVCRADLVIDRCAIYELKTTACLTNQHKSQLLQYLWLTELAHGKLINFAAPKVESEFVSTNLNLDLRRQLNIDDSRFSPSSHESQWLKELILELLDHWGGFLDTSLYYEAVYHFAGGRDKVIKSIEVLANGEQLGLQNAHLIESDIAFKITSFSDNLPAFRNQLQSILRNTRLKQIHWFNFDKHTISIETISQQ